MSIGSTAADYLQQLINLAPTGLAWPTDPASNWVKLLTAISETWARIDASDVSLANEALPDTTTQLLPNWERVAGIPDECSDIGDTLQVRRANLITKLTNGGGQSKAYFIELAATLGYTITITESRPFQVGRSKTGDPLNNAPWQFAWQVHSALNTVIFFRADQSSAEEPLESWSNARLECFIRRYAPAHTVVSFAYS
jgi:uncharacterized protein YmfQ (DUF2313 family)